MNFVERFNYFVTKLWIALDDTASEGGSRFDGANACQRGGDSLSNTRWSFLVVEPIDKRADSFVSILSQRDPCRAQQTWLP